MFVLFIVMVMRYWNDNKIQPYDREWGKRLSDVINNRDRQSAGDRQVQRRAKAIVLDDGRHDGLADHVGHHDVAAVLRRRYPDSTLIRIAAVVHMSSAFVLIVGIIVHVYAALFWVRGSLRAMTRGTVSRAWARHHHPLWYRRMTGGSGE